MKDFDYSKLNPGIRRTVKFLHKHGFRTHDSGDGKTHEYECDRPHAYVVIGTTPEGMVAECDRLYKLLTDIVGPAFTETAQVTGHEPSGPPNWMLVASYEPHHRREHAAMIDLMLLSDDKLPPGVEE